MKKIFLILSLCFLVIVAKSTNINGLTVIVEFIDYKFNATNAEISSLINQSSGYNNWGNNGSVNQFFALQSNAKIILNTQVVRVSLNKNYSYYNNTSTFDGGQALVNDVVSSINQNYPDGFTGLTLHPTENRLWFFLMIKSGPNGAGVAYGVRDNNFIKNDGSNLQIRSIALVGYANNNPEINVICHELGHHLFGWTDYYTIDNGQLGHYCMMGSGGSKKNPMPINPALRYLSGWITTVTDITGNMTNTYTVNANSTKQVYRYVNALNSKEYYLIEALVHGDYYVKVDGDGYIPDEGLAIWYVDEEGGTSSQFPKIKLVQADGKDQMNDINATHYQKRGDTTDLFNNVYPLFNTNAYPLFKWKDGSESGLFITNISTPSTIMSFKVIGRNNTITANTDTNGSIIPKGLIDVSNGQSQTFNFKSSIFFDIKDVVVDGISQGRISSYTFNDVKTNHTIYVSNKYVPSNIPTPWSRIDIGNIETTGKSDYLNGIFRIETLGSDIYWNSDNFHFIYQTLKGNGEIIAHVASMNKPQGWSKSGIMIRETLNANSRHIMMVKTVSNGIATQFRLNTGGASDNKNDASLNKKEWIKINRTNSTFTTYYSEDGLNWTLFDTRTISMNSDIYIGLCATGATANTPNISLFDNVSIISDLVTINASTVNPANSGIITGAGNYNFGASVSLTAIPASGYSFTNWTENGTQVSTDPTYIFTANANRYLVANFQINVGIEDIFDNRSISIYPNPNNGKFILQIENEYIGSLNIRIFNTFGNFSKIIKLDKTTNKMTQEINLENFAKGVYFMDIISNNHKKVKILMID